MGLLHQNLLFIWHCYLIVFLSFFSLKKNSNIQLLARFSPMLLVGAGEQLVNFLKDDNEIIKEGALHVLAKAGGTIREQLAVSSRCGSFIV